MTIMNDRRIITIEEAVINFHTEVSQLLQTYHVVCDFTLEVALEMMLLLVDDLVNDKLLWVGRTRQFEKRLDDYFRWFDERGSNKMSDKMLDIIEVVEFELRKTVAIILPKRTWQIWTHRLMPEKWDIIFQLEYGGEDYRIVDWTNQQKRKQRR